MFCGPGFGSRIEKGMRAQGGCVSPSRALLCGFGFEGSGFEGSGFEGSGFRVQGSGFRIQVQGSGVQDLRSQFGARRQHSELGRPKRGVRDGNNN
eukprot:2535340-Rhodomonas_salina.1